MKIQIENFLTKIYEQQNPTRQNFDAGAPFINFFKDFFKAPPQIHRDSKQDQNRQKADKKENVAPDQVRIDKDDENGTKTLDSQAPSNVFDDHPSDLDQEKTQDAQANPTENVNLHHEELITPLDQMKIIPDSHRMPSAQCSIATPKELSQQTTGTNTIETPEDITSINSDGKKIQTGLASKQPLVVDHDQLIPETEKDNLNEVEELLKPFEVSKNSSGPALVKNTGNQDSKTINMLNPITPNPIATLQNQVVKLDRAVVISNNSSISTINQIKSGQIENLSPQHRLLNHSQTPQKSFLQTLNPKIIDTQKEFLPQLGIQISSAAHEGLDRIRLFLRPPQMGTLDVQLDFDPTKNLTATIFVEKKETLDFLLRDQALLQQTLKEAGLQLQSGGLQFALRQDQQSFNQPSPSNTPSQANLFSPEEEAILQRLYQDYGLLALDGRLDIRI